MPEGRPTWTNCGRSGSRGPGIQPEPQEYSPNPKSPWPSETAAAAGRSTSRVATAPRGGHLWDRHPFRGPRQGTCPPGRALPGPGRAGRGCPSPGLRGACGQLDLVPRPRLLLLLPLVPQHRLMREAAPRPQVHEEALGTPAAACPMARPPRCSRRACTRDSGSRPALELTRKAGEMVLMPVLGTTGFTTC